MWDKRLIEKKKYVIFSVIGSHAGESEDVIFARKKKEITDTGRSFWLINSTKAKTEDIQKFCKRAHSENEEVLCMFIEPSSSRGSRPTKTSAIASKFSIDKINWEEIPKGIKITGNIKADTSALVFDELEVVERYIRIDLWNYSDFINGLGPVKTRLGGSTICAVKKFNKGMKSRYRRVIGVGRLTKPFAVWLK